MKRVKGLLTVLCAMIMVLGITTSAVAYSITPAEADWNWLEQTAPPTITPVELTYNNPDAGDIAVIVGYTGDINLFVELYKQDVGLMYDVGPYAESYNASFDPPDDPEDAIIAHVAGKPVIGTMGSPLYLLVKDGNHDPIWYLFDVSDWNRTENIVMTSFWPNGGAISHVSLYAPVPIPPAAWLLGSGLIGLVAVRRRFKK